MTTGREPIDGLGDEEVEAEAEAQRKLEAQRDRDAYQWLMASVHGRRIAGQLLDFCGVWRSSYSRNAQDTSFNEGQRNVGLMLLHKLTDLTPERLVQLLKERSK